MSAAAQLPAATPLATEPLPPGLEAVLARLSDSQKLAVWDRLGHELGLAAAEDDEGDAEVPESLARLLDERLAEHAARPDWGEDWRVVLNRLQTHHASSH